MKKNVQIQKLKNQLEQKFGERIRKEELKTLRTGI